MKWWKGEITASLSQSSKVTKTWHLCFFVCFGVITKMDHLLKCLDCPLVGNLNVSLKADVVRLVSWLEDRKIRELEITERALLKDAETFDTAFIDYLARLQCPVAYAQETRTRCLEWLVGHAISAEYEDSAEACRDLELTREATDTTISMAHDGALAAEADTLGSMVGVARAPGQTTPAYLSAIAKKVRLSLAPGALSVLKEDTGTATPPLAAFALGFDCGDAVVNQVATVLKMLHLFDFRELQNDLNALIVLGQEYTANPRTNSKLGKVGR